MKRILWFPSLILLSVVPAGADQEIYRQISYDWARVIRVEPVVEIVEVTVPDEECRDREIRTEYCSPRRSVAGSTIVGGAVGGVLGSVVGHGRARPFTTIGGAILGVPTPKSDTFGNAAASAARGRRSGSTATAWTTNTGGRSTGPASRTDRTIGSEFA